MPSAGMASLTLMACSEVKAMGRDAAADSYFGNNILCSLSTRALAMIMVTNSLLLPPGCLNNLMKSCIEMPSAGIALIISCFEGRAMGRGAAADSYFGNNKPASNLATALTKVRKSFLLSRGCATILRRPCTEMPSAGTAFLMSCSEGKAIGRGAAGAGAGDVAREEGAGGEPPTLSLMRRARVASDMAAPSVSVSDPARLPAPPRRRTLAADGSSVPGADELGTLAGEPVLECPGVGCVEDRCLDLTFFLLTEASVPDASDPFGEAGRLSEREEPDFFIPLSSRSVSRFSLRPDGVFVPEEGRLDFLASSSSFCLARRSSSRRSSSSSLSVFKERVSTWATWD